MALRSTLGYLIMPRWGERSGYGSVFKKLGDCPRVFWVFILLGPKRSVLAGLVKFLAVGCGLNEIAGGLSPSI